MKVGIDFVASENKKKKRKMSYKDVEYDKNGWADANIFLPPDYEIMFLKVKDKGVFTGWSVGRKWDGAKVSETDQVTAWKRKHEDIFKLKYMSFTGKDI